MGWPFPLRREDAGWNLLFGPEHRGDAENSLKEEGKCREQLGDSTEGRRGGQLLKGKPTRDGEGKARLALTFFCSEQEGEKTKATRVDWSYSWELSLDPDAIRQMLQWRPMQVAGYRSRIRGREPGWSSELGSHQHTPRSIAWSCPDFRGQEQQKELREHLGPLLLQPNVSL